MERVEKLNFAQEVVAEVQRQERQARAAMDLDQRLKALQKQPNARKRTLEDLKAQQSHAQSVKTHKKNYQSL